jgi:hypothetical protein
MIVDIGGRQISVRTPQEDIKLLESDYKDLTPEEKVFVETILREAQETQDGVKTLLKLASEAEYEREVVDVRTWLDDDYYFGEVAKGLWPKLKEDVVELFTGSYHEVVLGGAIGWGKSTFAEIVIARQIYEMSCLRNPQRSYGLASGSEIVFAGISVNEKTAMATLLEGLAQKLIVSPYFNEKFKCHRSMEALRFPKNIWAVPASSADNSVIGRNVFGAAIDETNFMSFTREQKASHARWGHIDKGSQLYSSILRRMKSRFLRGGQMPGMLMTISSKKGTTDFTERKIRESADNPRIFVREYALWDVKKYSDQKFRVVIGTDDVSSRVLADSEPVPDTVAQGKQRIIEVPIDFRSDFEEDLDGSLREIAGIATDSIRPYIRNKEKIIKALSSKRPMPRPGGLEWDPTTPLALDWSALCVERQRRSVNGKTLLSYKPRFNPDAQRHIHLDPALSDDSYGFAMGHVAKMVEVVRTNWSSGKKSKEMVPFIVIDLALRIVPPDRGEIPMAEVRRLIYELTEHGFHIGLVTMDTYQCLAAGTRVSTSRGLLPIEEVLIGDIVQSRAGPKPVKNVWAFGRQPVLKLSTADGDSLVGTGRHRIEVQVGWGPESESEFGWTREPIWEWRRLDEIRAGDVVRMASSPVEMDAPDVELVGDKRDLGWSPARAGVLSEWSLPVRMGPALAEWLGLVWGDGNIGEDSVRLTVTDDEAVDAQAVFMRLFGVAPEYRGVDGAGFGTVSVSARWLVRWMEQNGLRKPLVPEAVLRGSRAVKASFLRGLFATDGNVGRLDGYVSLSTKHRDLADQVRLMLRCDFGIESKLVIMERGHPGDYVKDGVQYVVGVRGARRKFLERIGFSYSRKQVELEKHVGVVGRRIFARVVSVEADGEADVFDLEVEDDPSYLANGFMSHNSADMRQNLNSKGYKAEVLSVDSSSDAYDLLKNAINEERFDCLPFPHLEKELRQLEWNPKRKKVDHPQDGSKDVADGLAGVTMSLTTRLAPQPLVASPGISEYRDATVEDIDWVLPRNEKGETMRPKEEPGAKDNWAPLLPVKG